MFAILNLFLADIAFNVRRRTPVETYHEKMTKDRIYSKANNSSNGFNSDLKCFSIF